MSEALTAWIAEILPLLDVLGIWVSGDLGPLTIYTNRHGRIIAYPKSPPERPPSELQLRQRGRFAMAQQQWMQLPTTSRAAWEQLVRASSLDMTGQNAYISLALTPSASSLATLNAKAGLSLPAPTPVPN